MNIDKILEIWNEEHRKSKCLNESVIRFAYRIQKLENDRNLQILDKIEEIFVKK